MRKAKFKIPICPFCKKQMRFVCYIHGDAYFKCSKKCQAVAEFLGFDEPVPFPKEIVYDVVKNHVECFRCRTLIKPERVKIFTNNKLGGDFAISYNCGCTYKRLKDYTIHDDKISELLETWFKTNGK